MILEDAIATLIESAREHGLPSETTNALVADLRKAAKEEAASRDKVSAPKTRLVAFLRSSDPVVIRAAEAGVFIASVPDDASTATYSGQSLLGRLRSAITAHNDAPKGKRKAKVVIQTWQQAFAHLRPKTIKASGSVIGIKQKGTPAEVVVLTKEEVK
jgi:predicted RNase H-like HicB family nuclease